MGREPGTSEIWEKERTVYYREIKKAKPVTEEDIRQLQRSVNAIRLKTLKPQRVTRR